MKALAWVVFLTTLEVMLLSSIDSALIRVLIIVTIAIVLLFSDIYLQRRGMRKKEEVLIY